MLFRSGITVSASGTVYGNEVYSTNDVSASGTVYGNEVYSTNDVSAGGNVYGANFATTGSGGNITGANVILATTISATGNVVPITSASTGNILGVFNGCLIEVNPTTKKPKWQNFYSQTNVAQGAIDAYVIDDPNQLYLVKSTNTALGNSAVGTSFGIVYAAGNTTNGLSGVYLDLGAANATGQLLVLSTSQFVDNIPATTNEDFVVKVKSAKSIA